MKPKISTGYLTPQAVKKRKETKTRSAAKAGTSKQDGSEFDDKAFQAVMQDPVKKAMIMQLLKLNKDAIQDYKKHEAQTSVSPVVSKVKKKMKIESPSSLMRRRALYKLNSQEDDSHSSSSLLELAGGRPPSAQSVSTYASAESNSVSSYASAESSVPFGKIMEGVVAFVEIRSKDQDRSDGAKKVLEAMGAKVREKFTSDVTHVIFKDGSYSTYQKAKLMKVPLVSILWVEFSRKSLQKQPEKKFLAMRSNHFEENTSIICSQMQKEYEDIIRDEYRQSIMSGTPLPPTRSLINRRRTLMTTSSTVDLLNTIDNSFQGNFDKEVAQLNTTKDNDKEILTINTIDFDSYDPSPEIGSPLKSVENTKLPVTPCSKNVTSNVSVEMDLTNVDSENSICERRISKNIANLINSPLPKNTTIAPGRWLSRRKTFCSSILMSDESEENSSKKKENDEDPDSTHCSLISSDKPTSKFVAPTYSAKKTKKSRDSSSSTASKMSVPHISDDEDLRILSKNACKQNTSGDSNKSNQSSNLSSEKQIANKIFNSSMSSLHLSSDSDLTRCSLISLDKSGVKSKSKFVTPTTTTKKTKRSRDGSSSTSKMSSLHISDDENSRILSKNSCKKNMSGNSNKSNQLNNMSSSNLSSEKYTTNKISNSSMSSLRLSSDSDLTRCSLISSDKSGVKSTSKFLTPTATTKKTKRKRNSSSTTSKMPTLHISEDEESRILSKNACKQDASSHSNKTNPSNGMSSLNLSPQKEMTNKISNSSMSTLYLSSDKPSPVKKSNSSLEKKCSESTMSRLNVSSILNVSKGSFNSSDSSSKLDKGQIDNIISVLHSPCSIEPGTNPLNTHSDDSEVELPGTSPEKAIRISKRPRKFVNKNIVSLSKEDKNLKGVTDNDSRKKSLANVKRLSGNMKTSNCHFSEDETPIKKQQPKEVEKVKSITRKSTRLSNILPVSDFKKPESTNICNNPGRSSDSESDRKKEIDNKTPSNSSKRKQTELTKEESSSKKIFNSGRRSESKGDERSTTSESESDSNNKCRRRRRLYDPDALVLRIIQPDDEIERQKIAVPKRRRSRIPGNEVIRYIDKSPGRNMDGKDNLEPMKKLRKPQKKTNAKVVDDPADEKKSLFNEIMEEKKKSETDDSSKNDETQFPKPLSVKSNKKSAKKTEVINSNKRLFSKRATSEESSSDEKRPNVFNRRSTLDFQMSSQFSPPKKPKLNKTKLPTIVCTKLHKPEVEVFTVVVKKLGGFLVEDEVSSRTTHLVAGEPKRTVNMLRAVARGCWILKHEWLLKSLEHGKWLPEEDYEETDFASIVQKSRLQRQAFGASYTMNIFQECDPIYVARGSTPRCSDLRELISLCHGKVVNCHRSAKIVVGEYVEGDLTCVNETWVLDCITFNKKLPFKKKYLIES